LTARDRAWPYLITALAAASSITVVLDVTGPFRPAVVLGFALVCPGMALVRLMRLPEPWPELLLAIVMSLCLSALIATASIYLGAWNPRIVLLAIVIITLVAVMADALRRDERAG
jgi:hypothetical protein